MVLKPRLITDEIYKRAVDSLKTLDQNNRKALRLKAIISAKTEGMATVAKVFGVTTNTLRSWVKYFEKEGVSGLDYHPGRGRKSNLSEPDLEFVQECVRNNPNMTIIGIVQQLGNDRGIKSSKSAIHRILHKLKLSYITPRPVHHKQDKETHLEFKKKSTAKNRSPS